jgi:4-oxalocrotonate tautomerase
MRMTSLLTEFAARRQAALVRRAATRELAAMSLCELSDMGITRLDVSRLFEPRLVPEFRSRGRKSEEGNETMPHVIIKLLPGRSAQQKARIAEEVTKAVMATANCAETSVSVGIEDVASDDWTEMVYQPDILGKPDTIYRKPGYKPL